MLAFLAKPGMRVRYRRRPEEVFTVLRRSSIIGRLVITGSDKKELVVQASELTEEDDSSGKPEASSKPENKPGNKLEIKPEATSNSSDENGKSENAKKENPPVEK